MKKKLIPFVMMACLLSLVGCRKTSDDRDPSVTYIDIQNFGGGIGSEWITSAAQRFSEIQKEHSYETGKKGVKISVQDSKSIDESQMGSSTYQIYFTENGKDPYELVSRGLLLNITDVVKGNAYGEAVSIESKLDDGIKGAIMSNGNYYALPHYEFYPGVSYDIDLFNSKMYYFAAPNEPNSIKKTYFGRDFYFCDFGVKKSCGNDGLYDTADDGLPTTLMEFLALCAYINVEDTPIIFPGDHVDYSNYMLEAILGGLVGKEGISQFYDFSGNANVVIGYKDNEELFFEGSGIKAPIYQSQTITERTGYKTRLTVERYYVLSLGELLEKNGYFSIDSKSTLVNNISAQRKFIYGEHYGASAKNIAMICEGNYWMNESHQIFDDFFRDNPTITERNIGWMSLPTSLDTPAIPGQTRTGALMDIGYSYCLLNKKYEGTGKMDAALDFIRFIYSENELCNFTKLTGVCKAGINYTYDSEAVGQYLNDHQKQVLALKRAGGVVYTGATNKTFLSNRKAFLFGLVGPAWMPSPYKSVVDALRGGFNSKKCFEVTQIEESKWLSDYYIE